MKKSVKLLGVLSLSILLLGAYGSNKKANENTTTKKKEELALYVVRHGKTMLNTTDRVQGWSDAVLTKEGEEVVTAAGKGLGDVDFQNAYSSDSGRAVQTAELIIKENKKSSQLEVQKDPGLREFNFGTYEGDLNHTMWGDIAKKQGVTTEEFMKTMTPKSFADSVAEIDKEKNVDGKNWPAEDFETITTRLTKSIDEIVEKEMENEGSGNVLVVSHGLSISALLDTLFDDFKMPEGGLKNASVSVIKVKDGKYTLESVNDTSYIEAGKK
ncbi:histidine phosphatase family protein [Vagococcus fluvialis]|uniref:histidine phosphatase family protein n=1 Tax=Vagococcus fluvialis TaxID=2738 RepID=UPI003B5998CC